jgi:DNA-binding NarL/FixJ family response regulator
VGIVDGCSIRSPTQLISRWRQADMAARGLANRNIAQVVFVSERTVELHLTHAYQKLGISSRHELGPAL